MTDKATWKFNQPLGIRITGSGEFVRQQTTHLVDLFEMAQYDHEQELRADAE